MPNEPFSIRKRLKSFVYAGNGIKILLRNEHNARIHLFAIIIVIALGFLYNISSIEWIAVLLSIALVFSMEMINSAIENICNFISPEKHESIKIIKDLAAGAVLVSAIIAMIIGLIIFVPKII
jgi:diacylglycerol kinase